MIRSLLDYGAPALDSTTKTNKKKMESIQYQALRISCGAMTGTALSALQNECGEPPLEIRRMKQMIQLAIKIKSNNEHVATKTLQKHWTTIYGKYPEKREPFASKVQEFFDIHEFESGHVSDISPPWKDRSFNIDLSLTEKIKKVEPTHIVKCIALEELDKYNLFFKIYTDGSKDSMERVGTSFYIPELDIGKNYRLPDSTSVFGAELSAIKDSLEWIQQNRVQTENREILICTDSLSAIQAIKFKKKKINICNEIINLINSDRSKSITLLWIPGHVGIQGNEIADRLAKTACSLVDIRETSVDEHEFDQRVEQYIHKLWQDDQDRRKTGIFNKNINLRVSTKIKFEHPKRSIDVLITRLRLGKACLNKYLFDIGKHDSGLCDGCGQQETIRHYLMECQNGTVSTLLMDICKTHKIEFTMENILKESITTKAIYENTYRRL
jgi:ribonuclease HI